MIGAYRLGDPDVELAGEYAGGLMYVRRPVGVAVRGLSGVSEAMVRPLLEGEGVGVAVGQVASQRPRGLGWL
jgi:hypothetical protein